MWSLLDSKPKALGPIENTKEVTLVAYIISLVVAVGNVAGIILTNTV